MLDRRGFLRLLAGGAAAAVAPTKTFAFFGGILRPRQHLVLTPKSEIRMKPWQEQFMNGTVILQHRQQFWYVNIEVYKRLEQMLLERHLASKNS